MHHSFRLWLWQGHDCNHQKTAQQTKSRTVVESHHKTHSLFFPNRFFCDTFHVLIFLFYSKSLSRNNKCPYLQHKVIPEEVDWDKGLRLPACLYHLIAVSSIPFTPSLSLLGKWMSQIKLSQIPFQNAELLYEVLQNESIGISSIHCICIKHLIFVKGLFYVLLYLTPTIN